MTNPLENNSSGAKITYATLWLILPFPLLSIASSLWMVLKMYDGHGILINPIVDNDEWQHEILYGRYAVSVIPALAFMAWSRTAYRNLKILQQHELSYSPGMAFYGWMIPLFNLFVPPRLLSEIWKFTPATLHEKRTAKEKEADEVSPIGWWWFFLVVGGLTASAGLFLSFMKGFDSVDYNYKGGWLTIVGSVMHVIALFIVLHIVKEISRREKALYERVQQQLDSGELEFATEEEIATEKS